jgi:hypothetical protein
MAFRRGAVVEFGMGGQHYFVSSVGVGDGGDVAEAECCRDIRALPTINRE